MEWIVLANDWASVVGAALLRASWHGGLALGIVYALCRLIPSLPAETRCWLWRIAYLKLVVALFWATPIPLPILPATAELPARWTDDAPRLLGQRSPTGDVTVPTITSPGASTGLSSQVVAVSARPSEGTGPSLLLVLLAAWTVGVVASGARVLRQWQRTSRLRSGCEPSDDSRIAETLTRLCRRLGLTRPPELLSAQVPGPLVVGVLRPAIVLPNGLQATDEEQEWILAHELAHVKRRDLLWAHLPVFTRVLLFFHPLVWLGHREWRLAQEMACDAFTLRLTSVSAGDYGEMLVKLAASHRARPESELSVARIFEPGTGLERRISMLPSSARPSGRAGAFAAALIALALVAVAPWNVCAQAASPAPPANERARPAPAVAASPRTVKRPPAAASPAALKQSAADAPSRAPSTSRKAATVTGASKRAANKAVKATPPRPATAAPRPPAARKPALPAVVEALEPAEDAYLRHIRDVYDERFRKQADLGLRRPDPPPPAEGGDQLIAQTAFRATGLNVGPYTSLIGELSPVELIEFLKVDLQAARSLLEAMQARVNAGQAVAGELIPLDARVRQLAILISAAERLALRARDRDRADLFRSLTGRELVQYLAIELNATRQLHELQDAQFKLGIAGATEAYPLAARVRQLEILLRAAERRAERSKGEK